MNFSADQQKVKEVNVFRIVAGVGLGAACLAAVVMGGMHVGRSFEAMLDTVDLIAPADIDPLR